MNKSIHIFLALTIFLLTTLGCNLQNVTQPTLSVDDQAATIIAQTLQAGNANGADVPITTTSSSTPNSTVTSMTATVGPTATITPTYSVPMLTLREQTNCRTGPGLSYDILFAYVKGVKREILGYYPQENYWLIKAPESATGECWIWGEYAEITGSYWVVPSLTPPPTATLTPPIAPSISKWDFFCNSASGEMNITILWKDNTNNESAFVVYRNGQQIAQLPANSNSYSETILFQAGDSFKYQVEVLSPGGSALSPEVSVSC
jgi:hypothetical protein